MLQSPTNFLEVFRNFMETTLAKLLSNAIGLFVTPFLSYGNLFSVKLCK